MQVPRMQVSQAPLLQVKRKTINDIRRRHSVTGDKKVRITNPVHMSEFKRHCRTSESNEECKVIRFYFPQKNILGKH